MSFVKYFREFADSITKEDMIETAKRMAENIWSFIVAMAPFVIGISVVYNLCIWFGLSEQVAGNIATFVVSPLFLFVCMGIDRLFNKKS